MPKVQIDLYNGNIITLDGERGYGVDLALHAEPCDANGYVAQDVKVNFTPDQVQQLYAALYMLS